MSYDGPRAPDSTESRNANTNEIDLLPPEIAVELFLDEEQAVLPAVRAATPTISRLISAAKDRWRENGRLFYVGAGTSARIATVDAVSLTSTFGIDRERVRVLAAGGRAALGEAIGTAEDDRRAGDCRVSEVGIGKRDIVIALSASGRTPYILGAAEGARRSGALVGAVVCNQSSLLSQEAHITIELLTGAEVIMGSTRLKAGTAQKIALNAFSTILMVQLGYTYSNLMVNLLAANQKLRSRAVRIVAEATGRDRERALRNLGECSGDVKLAILTLLTERDSNECAKALALSGQNVRAAAALLSGTNHEA